MSVKQHVALTRTSAKHCRLCNAPFKASGLVTICQFCEMTYPKPFQKTVARLCNAAKMGK